MIMRALVVGGTGMLSGLSIWLAQEYEAVTVIGKTWSRLTELIDRAGDLAENIIPLSVDYTDREKLIDAVKKTMWRYGPFDLVVTWVRSGYSSAINAIAEEIADHTLEEWRLFRVMGSMPGNEEGGLKLPSNAKYREVVLGFVLEGGGSRWLTNDEIWKGVRDAIVKDSEHSTVGVTEPLDRMPQ